MINRKRNIQMKYTMLAKYGIRVFFTGSLILLSLICRAQEKLTLEQCIILAKEADKTVQAAMYGEESAGYEKSAAKANFFPSFSISGIGTWSKAKESYSSGDGMLPVFGQDGKPTGSSAYFPGINLNLELGLLYSIGVTVEQPIYMGGKVRTGYKMASLGNELASQNRRLAEQDIIINVSKSYANAVKASEIVKVAMAYRELLEELMRSVESARRHGMKSYNDVLKVKVKLDESILNLQKVENGFELALMDLCRHIGYKLTADIKIDTLLPAISMHSGMFSEIDITNRPEYIMLEKKSELAMRKVNFVKSDALPQLGVFGQYGYLHGLELNNNKLLGDWNFIAGVKLSVPLFHFGGRANKVRSAKALYKQTAAERENTNSLLELEAVQAANNLKEAELELKLALSSVESANENLRTSTKQYEAGLESLSDLLEAQTLWQQANQALIDARIGRYISLITYQKVSGQM